MSAAPDSRGAQDLLGGRVRLLQGDCLERLAGLPEASVDAVVTDPPYHLVSIVRRFGKAGAAPDAPAAPASGEGPLQRASRGFMGETWDGGDVAFRPATWAAVLRVLKPGGHLVAFAGTKGFARMAVAIEDAGFETRNTLAWLYGSGFPKSHDVAKAIDKVLGAEGSIVPSGDAVKRMIPGAQQHATGSWIKDDGRSYQPGAYLPATEAAAAWQGWGTDLKPALELIALARRPLAEGSVARQVLATGTGAVNVDGCRVEMAAADRVEAEAGTARRGRGPRQASAAYSIDGVPRGDWTGAKGRWPANVLTDGSAEVVEAFGAAAGDGGSPARFFYSAKADAEDRAGSRHPTVKPVDLMQWLVRLVCPKGGVVLDPFAGTGTTGEAAWREGCRALLIEQDARWCADIRRRMALAELGPDGRRLARAKEAAPTVAPGPLFGGDP